MPRTHEEDNRSKRGNRLLDRRNLLLGGTALAAASALHSATSIQTAQAQQAAGQKPNILVIMGDDVGWFNIGAYHRGMMSGKTPNLDKLASEGMMFTDYYAEASCTAGRANFITGELPIRTGLTTVGQAGADVVLVLTMVDREEGATDNFAEAGLPFRALYRASEFL